MWEVVFKEVGQKRQGVEGWQRWLSKKCIARDSKNKVRTARKRLAIKIFVITELHPSVWDVADSSILTQSEFQCLRDTMHWVWQSERVCFVCASPLVPCVQSVLCGQSFGSLSYSGQLWHSPANRTNIHPISRAQNLVKKKKNFKYKKIRTN